MTIKYFLSSPTEELWPRFEERVIMGATCISLQEKDRDPTVFRIKGTDNVIKLGPHVHEGEYKALCLLFAQGIPVPEPLRFGVDPDTGFYYIRMRYVEGERLTDVWDVLDQAERETVLSQLGDVVVRMRKNTASYIGSLDRTICNDNFLAAPFQPTSPSTFNGPIELDMNGSPGTPRDHDVFLERQWYGPFNDNKDFIEKGIIHYLRARGRYEQSTELVVQMIRALPDSPGPYVFTHGEVAPDNILVKDSKVVAILDWNQAGYYPEYWEYVKAHFWQYENCHQVDHDIDTILEPHFSELSILLHAKRIIW